MSLTLAELRAAVNAARNGNFNEIGRVLDAFLDGDPLAIVGVTSSVAELNILDGVLATADEINNVADVSGRVQELTASGAVTAGKQSIELNHATVVIAATIADLADHQGFLMVKDTSASGTAAHTVTASAGTWDGTNTVLTLNAPNEAILVYIDSAGNGTIIENVGAVALS